MRQTLILIFSGMLLFSCRKDKVPEPCTNVELKGKQLSVVGTWRWYKTWVNQTFASGNTYTFDYTPTTEGFNYYCVITEDGVYRGYKDSVLVHEHLMSSVRFENFDDVNRNAMSVYLDCYLDQLSLGVDNPSSNDSIIDIWEYPIRFDDELAKKYSKLNFFKRQ